MLSKRVMSAAVLIPIVGLVVYWGGLPLAAVITIVGCLAMYEYLVMIKTTNAAPSLILGIILMLALIADAQWPDLHLLLPTVVLGTLVALAREVFRKNVAGSLNSWGLTVGGAIYIGASLSFFLRLRALPDGLLWLILALLGTWLCDSGAYFVGISVGRTKLIPEISPKKTWEGAIGGLVFGVLTSVLFGYFALDLSVWKGLIIGVGIVIAATIGDLAESVIKRQIGVKDSSHLIPGHGGMLDRVDSLLFVVPLVYFCALWLA